MAFWNNWRSDRPTKRVAVDESLVDVAGRIRVANPRILFNGNLSLGKSALLWDEIVYGTGTSTFVSSDICVNLAVATTGDYVIRQTRSSFNYQADKPLRADMTGICPKATGVIARMGPFRGYLRDTYEPYDGLFLECNNGVAYLCECKGGNITRVPQSEWNCDKLDGTGPSGQTIDFSKMLLMAVEYEWLGIGNVRWSFMMDGTYVTAHVSRHANLYATTYIRCATLPLRYEIRSTGGSATMRQQCCSMTADGGEGNFGITGCVDNDGNQISIAVGVKRPIVLARINPLYPEHAVEPVGIYLINSAANTKFRWALVWNPTVVGTPNWVDFPSSAVQTWTGTGAETVSAEGLVMDAGYADSSLRTASSSPRTSMQCGVTCSGYSDIIGLFVESTSGTCLISGGIQMRQLL
jgi:hypothetical protein